MKKIPEKRNGLYYLNYQGREYVLPSVTAITGDAMPKPDLLRWAARTAAREALNNPTLSEEEVLALVTRKKTDGASRGALVHDFSEALDNNHAPSMDGVPEDVRPYIEALGRFMGDFSPSLVCNEVKVCNLTHGYAGRMDRVYKIKDQNVLVDYKTSPNYYPEMGLQLAAYKNAEFMFRDAHGPFEPMPHIDSTMIVLLGKDGTYSTKPTDEPLELFLALKTVWKWMYHEKSTLLK